MKLIVAFVFLLCEAMAFTNQESNKFQLKYLIPAIEGEKVSPRIVNGEIAEPDQFPYVASLRIESWESKITWCGGALISHTWVITAAHCLWIKKSVVVSLGTNIRLQAPVKYNLTSRNMFPHYAFKEEGLLNDIALIKIPAVTYSREIQPIDLPNNGYLFETFSIATTMGWGNTATNGNLSYFLMYTQVRVIFNEKCTYYSTLNDMKLCTETYLGGGICYGDSGGPLVERSKQILIGISSQFAKEGCLAGPPDVYTRITSYLGWIHNVTGIRN